MSSTEIKRPAPSTGAGQAPGRSTDDVEARIAELSCLLRGDLVTRWQATFGSHPPKGISIRLMIGALAYAIQAKRYGGLKTTTRRRLETSVEDDWCQIRLAGVAPVGLGQGARLVREWNGTTHVVDVIEGGYLWRGRRYASLSAIARAITGARWSGPRFFGLNGGQTS